MYPTFLDIDTGREFNAKQFDLPVHWWTEGNGSCDCNRAIAAGDSAYEELEALHGPHACFGMRRFLAIDVHGDLEGYSKEDVINMMNEEYATKHE
jgi:hypothetical protein